MVWFALILILVMVACLFYLFTVYPIVGILLLLAVVGLVVLLIIRHRKKKAKMREAIRNKIEILQKNDSDYWDWLKKQGFVCGEQMGGEVFYFDGKPFGVDETCDIKRGGFVFDANSRKWGKVGYCKLFDFSEIVGVEVVKHRKSSTNTDSTSNRNSSSQRKSFSFGLSRMRFGSSKYSGSGSIRRNKERVYQDESTYQTLIKTSNIEDSLISIPCGTSNAEAERVKATVKNIILSNKVI